MKLFSVIDCNNEKIINFFTLQETAIIINRLPFFLPFFSKDIIPKLCFVIKISRVGRHIEPKFAYKYYNMFSVAIHFIANDILNDLKSQSLPWDIAVSYDASLSLGNFLPYAYESGSTININIKYGQSLQQTVSYCINNYIINNTISRISNFFTLKNGDIILFPITCIKQEIKENDIIKISINDISILRLKIK